MHQDCTNAEVDSDCMNKKEAILLFSGGRDSFLSACYLIENKFKVHMVTFENGAGLQTYNAKYAAGRIIKRFGEKRCKFLGIKNIAGLWRDFFLPYFNMKPSEVIREYGELTVSQFNCLTCRSAMYTWSIIKAKQMQANYIAEGARKDQGFVIELPNMIERFKRLLSEYSLELLLPVYELDSDWDRKNLLLLRGFVPKTLEPQCLVGVPLKGGKAPDESVQKAVERFFDKVVLPRVRELIQTQSNVILEGRSEL